DGLAPDLKKVIDANSGMAASAWLGKTQQGNDPAGRKSAVDRGNSIYQFTAAQREEFIKLSSKIDDEWVADMDKRGYKGAQLLQSAKDLIAKHGRG
ncbi:MAG: C4-dicarboxylate ABC transporter, partial [Rubrivivax sp.]|nr:C4-dicarboxylate ABC transporter [Rubrivivax sp.]